MVTPHVGVWIETPYSKEDHKEQSVTPHVGVWIETSDSTGRTIASRSVTPHVGVWIETLLSTSYRLFNTMSHLM